MSPSIWRWPGGYDWLTGAHPGPHGLRLRRVVAARDTALLRQWFGSERGRFWAMPDKSAAGIQAHYERMQRCSHACAFLGHAHAHEQPAFVIECYDPAYESIAAHYPVQPGDLGLHLFVAPPSIRVPHFTREVFRFVLAFMFHRLHAHRVVVEPDIANLRIHALNRRMGFREIGRVVLPDKLALLALCTRVDFLSCQPVEPPV